MQLFQTSRIISITPCIQYTSKRFGWRRRQKRSRIALAARRQATNEQLESSRRELFPDLDPTQDNFPLYQSFLDKYKLGMILNETFRLRYYGELFPAMDTMRNVLIDNNVLNSNVNYNATQQPITSNQYSDDDDDDDDDDFDDDIENVGDDDQLDDNDFDDDTSSSDDDNDNDKKTIKRTDNQPNDDGEETEYEYEYEYETDEEFEEEEEEETVRNDKK